MAIRIGFIALGFAVTIATAAQAFTIDPQCQSMSDKVGCTCALQTGGRIVNRKGSVWWEHAKGSDFAFRQCAANNGAK